jgi:hypothetical protein
MDQVCKNFAHLGSCKVCLRTLFALRRCTMTFALPVLDIYCNSVPASLSVATFVVEDSTFSRWPTWLSRSPTVRRTAIKLWRVLLRAQRATLAQIVVVVHDGGGRVLVCSLPSGELELPRHAVDAWIPVRTQIEGWLAQRSLQCAPSLVSVEGTPGTAGVTFVYAAKRDIPTSSQSDELWLEPMAAQSELSATDRHLLTLCASRSMPSLKGRSS